MNEQIEKIINLTEKDIAELNIDATKKYLKIISEFKIDANNILQYVKNSSIDATDEQINELIKEHASGKSILDFTKFSHMFDDHQNVENIQKLQKLQGQATTFQMYNKHTVDLHKIEELINKQKLHREQQEQEFFKKAEQERIMREEEVAQRKNQLTKLNQWIIQLEKIITALPQKNDFDIIDENTYIGAADKLLRQLKQYTESYENFEIDLSTFKSSTTKLINDNQNGKLSEHAPDSDNAILEVLANILLAITTIGIGYIIAALITQRFFNPIKINSDIENNMKGISEEVERLGIAI